MFTDIAGKPVNLICGANVTVLKELNLEWYVKTKHHQDKLKSLNADEKLQKVEELKHTTFKQTFFTRAKSKSEIAVNASFIVDEEIAKPTWWTLRSPSVEFTPI